MSKEIEKKFLICENNQSYASKNFFQYFKNIDELVSLAKNKGYVINQGYIDLKYARTICKSLGFELNFEPCELRIRSKNKDGIQKYFITLKSEGTVSRDEFEKSISNQEYDYLKDLTTGKCLSKLRLEKEIKGLIYEFDFYLDRSLIICEAEINDESLLEKIIAFGKDVTEDKSYKNKNLAK